MNANASTTRIGINGNLADAIYKSRILQCYEPGQVLLVTTPTCQPLLSFFSHIPSVKSVVVDANTVYREGHGEENVWTVDIDKDMTYPGHPDGWVINFVAEYCGLPKCRRIDWFGSYRNVFQRSFSTRFALYVDPDLARQQDNLLVKLQKGFPELAIIVGEETDRFENINLAAECSLRIVSFGVEMALMSALGLACIVDRGAKTEDRYEHIFRSYGETILDSYQIESFITQRLRSAKLDLEVEAQQLPTISVCIPTINCGDLLRHSVNALLPQLGLHDRICIIDNGNQSLRKSFTCNRIQLIEPPHNLGVSGSWNRFLREVFFEPNSLGIEYDWILMLNDDIELGENQLISMKRELLDHEDKWMVVGPYYWSVFAINRKCVENVGFFDESFYPALFEDNDYHYRLNLIDRCRYVAAGDLFTPNVKRNSCSLARQPSLNNFGGNQDYYVRKWGGGPGCERFTSPFG